MSLNNTKNVINLDNDDDIVITQRVISDEEMQKIMGDSSFVQTPNGIKGVKTPLDKVKDLFKKIFFIK